MSLPDANTALLDGPAPGPAPNTGAAEPATDVAPAPPAESPDRVVDEDRGATADVPDDVRASIDALVHEVNGTAAPEGRDEPPADAAREGEVDTHDSPADDAIRAEVEEVVGLLESRGMDAEKIGAFIDANGADALPLARQLVGEAPRSGTGQGKDAPEAAPSAGQEAGPAETPALTPGPDPEPAAAFDAAAAKAELRDAIKQDVADAFGEDDLLRESGDALGKIIGGVADRLIDRLAPAPAPAASDRLDALQDQLREARIDARLSEQRALLAGEFPVLATREGYDRVLDQYDRLVDRAVASNEDASLDGLFRRAVELAAPTPTRSEVVTDLMARVRRRREGSVPTGSPRSRETPANEPTTDDQKRNAAFFDSMERRGMSHLLS